MHIRKYYVVYYLYFFDLKKLQQQKPSRTNLLSLENFIWKVNQVEFPNQFLHSIFLQILNRHDKNGQKWTQE